MKTIVIACGTGAVSSVMMNAAMEELLGRYHIPAHIICCRYDQIGRHGKQADLIVTSVGIPTDVHIPTLMGTPFLTGQGVPKLEQDILKLLA